MYIYDSRIVSCKRLIVCYTYMTRYMYDIVKLCTHTHTHTHLVYTLLYIICMYPAQCEDGEVRLISNEQVPEETGMHGLAVVCSSRRWIPICDSTTESNSITVCRQLGYTASEALLLCYLSIVHFIYQISTHIMCR